jgi:hypothetical protein
MTIVLMVTTNIAFASNHCSSYIGRATINEVFKQSSGGAMGDRFVEIKLLDSSIDIAEINNWNLTVCADQKVGNSTSTYCEAVSLADADDTDSPWYTFDKNSLSANVFDLESMDVLLTDSSGDVIDYFSIDGYNEQEPSPACNYLYPTTLDLANNDNPFQVFRQPDGIGAWDKNQGATGDETPTEDNDGNSGSPALQVDNVTVTAGGTAVFTVTLTPAHDSLPATVSYETYGSATASAPGDYTDVTGTLTFAVGETTKTINVTTIGSGGGGTLSALAVSPNTLDANTCFPASVTVTATVSGSGGSDKEFFLVLSTATNAQITKQIGVGTIQSAGGAYAGDIFLSTSTGNGNWSSTGNGTLNPDPDADDNGAATYTFDASDNNRVVLGLDNAHAEALQITASDGGSVTTTSGNYTYLDNAFVITPITCTGASCPGTGSSEVVAGRDHMFEVAMWRRDRDDPTNDCAIATEYDSAFQDLKAWITRDGDDPTGIAPVITEAKPPIPPPGSTLPDATPGAANISLDFSSDPGKASFTLATTDVGKYVISILDDSRIFANTTDIAGSSATLTVRPFGLTLAAYQGAITNPQGTATAGNKFVAADDAFDVDVTARRWQTGDDTVDNDGIPDTGADLTNNATTAAFAWDTEFSETATYTPTAPATAALTATSPAIALGSYGAAVGTATAIKYAEVGSFTLQVDVTNYLNSGVNLSANTVVGRFYPDHFTLTGQAITPACGTFSYMDQAELGVSLNVEARNASNNLTTLYGQAVGYGFLATHEIVAENNNDGTDLSARLSDPSFAWVGGEGTVSSVSENFARDSSEDGHFAALAVGLRLTDPDGADFSTTDLDMKPADSNNCVSDGDCDSVQLGATQVRWGRVTLANAFGPEVLDLDMPIVIEYSTLISGDRGFVNSSDDTCTAFVAGDFRFDPTSYTDNLAAGETSFSSVSMSSGAGAVTLSAPGDGNNGSVDVTVAAPAHLLWNGVAGTNSPPATATFGLYKGPDALIYQRERY